MAELLKQTAALSSIRRFTRVVECSLRCFFRYLPTEMAPRPFHKDMNNKLKSNHTKVANGGSTKFSAICWGQPGQVKLEMAQLK